jgi:hypothetical protein
MTLYKQSTAAQVPILLAAGGTPVTGLTDADVEAYISKAGAAPAAFPLNGSNFTELSAADMPGVYVVDLAAGDTDTLGSLLLTFKDPLAAGTFDQYNVSVQVYSALFDDLESLINAVNANVSGLASNFADIKGAGFVSGTDSLKALSDDFSTNITGPVALQTQLADPGGTQNAPVGVGLWDVLGDGSVTLPDLSDSIGRILGLTHENFALTDQVYDGDNNLTSATVKLYPSKADAEADTNVSSEYTITATYNGLNQLTNYLMVLEP